VTTKQSQDRFPFRGISAKWGNRAHEVTTTPMQPQFKGLLLLTTPTSYCPTLKEQCSQACRRTKEDMCCPVATCPRLQYNLICLYDPRRSTLIKGMRFSSRKNAIRICNTSFPLSDWPDFPLSNWPDFPTATEVGESMRRAMKQRGRLVRSTASARKHQSRFVTHMYIVSKHLSCSERPGRLSKELSRTVTCIINITQGFSMCIRR
jgi:hypothetical protein